MHRPLLAGQRGVAELPLEQPADALLYRPLLLGAARRLAELSGDYAFFTAAPLAFAGDNPLEGPLRSFACDRGRPLELFRFLAGRDLFTGVHPADARLLLAVARQDWPQLLAWLGTVALRNSGSSDLWRVRPQAYVMLDPLTGVFVAGQRDLLPFTALCLEGSRGCVFFEECTNGRPRLLWYDSVYPSTRELGIALRKGLRDPYYEADQAAEHFGEKPPLTYPEVPDSWKK